MEEFDDVRERFTRLFSTVDSIKKTVENMALVLKYDKTFNDLEEDEEDDDEEDDSDEEEDEDEEDEEEDLMKEVSTLKYPKQITYNVVLSPAMKQMMKMNGKKMKAKKMKKKIL